MLFVAHFDIRLPRWRPRHSVGLRGLPGPRRYFPNRDGQCGSVKGLSGSVAEEQTPGCDKKFWAGASFDHAVSP